MQYGKKQVINMKNGNFIVGTREVENKNITFNSRGSALEDHYRAPGRVCE